MGSFTRVTVIYDDLPNFLSSFDGKIRIYGTFPQGENIYSGHLETKGIIVIGNESEGISSEVAGLVTDRISIPPYPQASGHDHAESLNASVATAIICSEFRRRTG
jgi:TrmH family RNA methyltransferase